MISHKILFSSAVIAFGSIILLISVLRNTRQVNINNGNNYSSQIEISDLLNKESSIASVPYNVLPNPGILPNSPFYWLKMIRDKINLISIKDLDLKSKTMIQYSNKRLHSGIILINEGSYQIGVTTITKAEKYLEIVGGIVNNPEVTQETKDLFIKSLLMHKKILIDNLQKLDPSQQEVYKKMIELNDLLIQQHIDITPFQKFEIVESSSTQDSTSSAQHKQN